MIGRPPNACVKCGHSVPQGAGFCPNCGTQIHGIAFNINSDDTPETLLPPHSAGELSSAGTSTIPAPTVRATARLDDVPTISASSARTSLDSPSPRAVRGDGPFEAGQQISPRYTILKMLGAGGMGAVYQAFDHELGVAVAIKVIRPAAQSDATAAKELEQRFKRELVLARQVTHKYVVRIHDLGEIDGIKYLTMPFVEGETLSAVLRRSGTLPLARVIKIAQQIAQGLAAAHEKGVIHRDLKPENIMIEQAADEPIPNAGDALIMDFGIARSVEGGATQTAAGSVIGTLEYMAPEQAQGKKVDQRCDQYSFGLMVYDMLVGRQRLESSENAMAELLSRIAAPPPALRSIKPDIPVTVEQVVMRCLQPNPDARYPTTQDLVSALDHLTPDGHVRSDVHEIVTVKTRPAWQVAAAAAVIIALAGTAGWVMSDRNSPGGAATASDVRERVSVLIGDFENRTGDPVFDGVIEQAIGLGIEGASFVTSYPRRDALRAAAAIKAGSTLNEETARLVAIREGVNTIITGSIENKGGGYHIAIKGIAPDATVRYTLEDDAASKADVLTTVGALAGNVRVALGDTAMPNDGSATGDTFTAASIEAARSYVQAQELQAAGKFEEAIKQYQETIKLDPDMGRAYSGIATQVLNLGRAAEAESYFLAALQRIDRMTNREKFRTRGNYYMFARKPEQAVKEFEALVKAYPGDTVGLGNLAFAHSQLRNFKEAMAVGRRASALFPNNVVRRNNAALYAMYAGQFDVAISESAEVLKLNPSFVRAYLARGLSEMALGRPTDAIKTFERLKGVSPTGASFALAGLADVALYEGRAGDAVALLKEGIAADTATKNTDGLALKHATLARALLMRGDAAGAARQAETAIAINKSDAVALVAGSTLAQTGNGAAALRVADAMANKLEADPQAYALLLRAEVSLAQRQSRAALEHARAAHKIADTWLGHVTLARAYLDLGAFAEASSEIDIAMTRSGEATAIALDEWPSFHYFPPLHYYKGVAEEGLKIPAAKTSLETFLKIKEGGDETGGLVADARKRLER